MFGASPKRSWTSVLRLLALLLVMALAADLAYKLARGNPGAKLVRSIAAHREPLAPSFRLKIIWPVARTWPKGLRELARQGVVTRRDLEGYPVVLNFFASWCDPCNREAGLLVAEARMARDHVIVLGLDVNDAKSDAVHFLRVHHVPYVAAQASAGTAESFGLIGLPETVYLDRHGRIHHVTRGQLSAQELEKGIASLFVSGPPLPGS
jgi:cytochrome c biogenesis protein CcmG/thiol:disulfide interchange protein DsbE